MLLRVEENKIVSRKSLDHSRSRRIRVQIYLLLVLLGILAQTRTNVAAEGDDIVKECICRILGLAGISYTTYFGDYLVVQRSALSCYLLFSQHVVDEDCPKKGVDRFGIPPYCSGSKGSNVVYIYAALDILDINGHNALIAWI
jgi:hypothetical protein